MLRRRALGLAAALGAAASLLSAATAFGDQTIGGACTSGAGSAMASYGGNNSWCNGSTWQFPAYQFGSSALSCTSTQAGTIQWTGSAFQGCNGSTWGSLASGGTTTLSSLLAATTTNSIDSGNWAQTWRWGTLTTQTALSFTTSSMTSGTLLTLSNSANGSNAGTILNVSNSETGAASYGINVSSGTAGSGYGIYSGLTATANTGYAIYANNATTTTGYAIYATTSATSGYGIYSALTASGNSGYAGYFSNAATGTTGYALYTNGAATINNGTLTVAAPGYIEGTFTTTGYAEGGVFIQAPGAGGRAWLTLYGNAGVSPWLLQANGGGNFLIGDTGNINSSAWVFQIVHNASPQNQLMLEPGSTGTAYTLALSATDTQGAGLNMALQAAAATATGVGGGIALIGGAGFGTGAGGTVTISGGGSASGAAGAVTLQGGTPTAGNGAAATVQGSAGVGTNKNGGNASLLAGAATGSGAAGTVSITAGGAGSGTGGAVTISGGNSTSGAAGAATVQGGTPTAGSGGAATIQGSAGVGTNKNGGNASLLGGAATGSGTAGTITITAGGAGSGTGGAVTISGGNSASGAAGAATVQGGTVAITAGAATGTGTAGAITFTTTGTEAMRITSTGLVGIGTTSPIAPLNVVGTYTAATFQTTVAGSASSAFIGTTGGTGFTNDPYINLYDNNGSNGSGFSVIFSGLDNNPAIVPIAGIEGRMTSNSAGSYSGILTFGTVSASSVVTERMRINETGSVGIGTLSPSAPLHVAGEAIVGTTGLSCTASTAGALRATSSGTSLQFCNGTAWAALIQTQSSPPPTAPAGSGYLVMTKTTYNGNLGGLSGADADCLTELATTSTGWNGYSTAKSNGYLTASNVHALLCNHVGCTNLMPVTTYYYASANNAAMGGASFTTDSNGIGPGDNVSWSAANRFGSAYTYWTNLGITSSTAWSGTYYGNSTTYDTCSDWTSSGSGGTGEEGTSGNTDFTRWRDGNFPACNLTENLICFVNP